MVLAPFGGLFTTILSPCLSQVNLFVDLDFRLLHAPSMYS